MKQDPVEFFDALRSIFGICPCCGEAFRLSDCRIYLKRRPARDWFDQLETLERSLEQTQSDIDENEKVIREKARAEGRLLAQKAIRRVDPVFAPLRLHADDAKVLFHPIDYVVFKGMNTAKPKPVSSIVLLDRERKELSRRRLQRTIERTVDKGNYEWLTLRIMEDGTTIEE